MPKINTWFIENQLGVDIICPQWFLTLFSFNDNKELFNRAVDLLLITGTKALFQIALSLLNLLHTKGHLESFQFGAQITTSEIIKNMPQFKVSNKLLKALEKNCKFAFINFLISQNSYRFTEKTEIIP